MASLIKYLLLLFKLFISSKNGERNLSQSRTAPETIKNVDFSILKEVFQLASDFSYSITGNSDENFANFEITLRQTIQKYSLKKYICLHETTPNSSGGRSFHLVIQNIQIVGDPTDLSFANPKAPFSVGGEHICGFAIIFENVSGNHGNLNISFNSYIDKQFHFTSLQIYDSPNFPFIVVDCSTFTNVRISNSSGIEELDHDKSTKGLVIEESKIGLLTLENGVETIRIRNSEFLGIDSDDILKAKNKHLLSITFTSSSIIKNPGGEDYKNLRIISERLGDKIQAHIFYSKEIDTVAKLGDIDFDSRVLIMVNKIANNHGLSVLQPVFLLFIVNYLFLLLILSIETIFNSNTELTNLFLLNFIDIYPLHSIFENLNLDKELLDISKSLDGFRRAILPIFYYLIVTAALRFRYKKPPIEGGFS